MRGSAITSLHEINQSDVNHSDRPAASTHGYCWAGTVFANAAAASAGVAKIRNRLLKPIISNTSVTRSIHGAQHHIAAAGLRLAARAQQSPQSAAGDVRHFRQIDNQSKAARGELLVDHHFQRGHRHRIQAALRGNAVDLIRVEFLAVRSRQSVLVRFSHRQDVALTGHKLKADFVHEFAHEIQTQSAFVQVAQICRRAHVGRRHFIRDQTADRNRESRPRSCPDAGQAQARSISPASTA